MGKVMFDKQGVLELCWNHGTGQSAPDSHIGDSLTASYE